MDIMTDTPTPASKPQTLRERFMAIFKDSRLAPLSYEHSAVGKGVEWGAKEVLSAPVSDAVLKAYYDARTVPGCDECEQRERAGVAQGLRPCERHRIAAAIKAIAAEMGVEL